MHAEVWQCWEDELKLQNTQHTDKYFPADLNKQSDFSLLCPKSIWELPCPGSLLESAKESWGGTGVCGHGPMEIHKYVLKSRLLRGSAVSSQLSQEARGELRCLANNPPD